MPEERVARLGALGFVWDSRAARWEEMLTKLEEFKVAHRHCDVPQQWPENPELGTWVGNLRARKSKGPADRVARLDALGFRG